MSHYVAFIEVVERDSVYTFQYVDGFDQAAAARIRQIDLCDVAGDHCLRVKTKSRDEHLHLLRSSVLRLVENDEAVVQRASAHECDRSDFDGVALKVAIHLLLIQQVIQSVVKRAKIGIDLLLQ